MYVMTVSLLIKMILKTEQGEGIEEKLDVCNLLQELHPQFYPYKTQSLSSPSWFEEAKYVHKTMPILLINILQTLTSDPKLRQGKVKA